MDNLILCSGCYAKTPFLVEEECIHLYSIEELCYYMIKNAWLLEPEFISEELLVWIGEELQLPQLSAALKKAAPQKNAGQKDGLLKFIELLIRETGYYEEDKIEWVRKILQSHSNMSAQEKKKSRADSYLRNQRYSMAADEYENLLQETDERQPRLRAKLFHNLGVCAAKQFRYEKAAEFFKQAYDMYANTESYVQYLTALKLSIGDQEYLSFLSGNPESYEDSLEVESRMRNVKQDWEGVLRATPLGELEKERENGSNVYMMLEKMTENCKDEYRNSTYRSSQV